jgi:hypothetical protein
VPPLWDRRARGLPDVGCTDVYFCPGLRPQHRMTHGDKDGFVTVLRLRRTDSSQFLIVSPEHVIASDGPAGTADTKTLHCPTRVRWRASVLTFCLTSC